MFRLSMDAIFSFSLAPLYIGMSLGGFLLCLALLEMLYVLSFWITGRTSNLAPGWSSLVFIILIVGGMLMVLLGFIGVYVGYIFQEVKRRPVYLLKKRGRNG
jgi:dolichol-phosphate mannosyltransferase